MSKGLIITGAVLLGLLAVGFGLYSYANSTRNAGVRQEAALNAQYLDNQNELSSFKASFYEQIGVANLKSEKIDEIITDAVKGRYDGKMAPGTGGAMFSAIAEAYPDIKGQLDVYDKIVDFIRASREAYKQKQTKLLDMLRAYDTWRREGFVRSFFVSQFGFPSSGLEARIGTDVKRGQEALDRMYIIVLTKDAKDSYETGIDTPVQVPGLKKK